MERIVVVGYGWVGQANALALKMLGYDVAYFDPGEPPHHYTEHARVYESIRKLSSITEGDSNNTWYMVCVGDRVAEDGTQDISNIKRALDSLKGVKGGVMLRSTIVPDTLAELDFDQYVPEFLHEKKAVEECLEPYLFVAGAKTKRQEPEFFALWESRAQKTFRGTPREAALIKYLSNLWNSVRIAFVNEFGDAIGRPSSKEELTAIERVIDFLFDGRSYMRYGKGFGGHCLPKDTRAFKGWYGRKSTLPMLEGVYASNAKHQALEEQFPLIPEWYSEWPEKHVSGWQALSDLLYAIGKHLRNPRLMFKRK